MIPIEVRVKLQPFSPTKKNKFQFKKLEPKNLIPIAAKKYNNTSRNSIYPPINLLRRKPIQRNRLSSIPKVLSVELKWIWILIKINNPNLTEVKMNKIIPK